MGHLVWYLPKSERQGLTWQRVIIIYWKLKMWFPLSLKSTIYHLLNTRNTWYWTLRLFEAAISDRGIAKIYFQKTIRFVFKTFKMRFHTTEYIYSFWFTPKKVAVRWRNPKCVKEYLKYPNKMCKKLKKILNRLKVKLGGW